MPARLATGIPQIAVPLRVASLNLQPACERKPFLLVVSSRTVRWGNVLLNLFFGLVCVLLLLLQIGGSGEVRSSRTVGILTGIGGRASGDPVLPLIAGKVL